MNFDYPEHILWLAIHVYSYKKIISLIFLYSINIFLLISFVSFSCQTPASVTWAILLISISTFCVSSYFLYSQKKRGTSIILIVRMMPVLSHSVSVVSDSLWSNGIQPLGFSVHGNTPGKNTGVGCHTLLQGIFPTHGWNWDLLHYRHILYQLSYQGMLSTMTVISPASITCLENFVVFNVHNTCVLMNLFIILWFFQDGNLPLDM